MVEFRLLDGLCAQMSERPGLKSLDSRGVIGTREKGMGNGIIHSIGLAGKETQLVNLQPRRFQRSIFLSL